jgi:hypothetical protein
LIPLDELETQTKTRDSTTEPAPNPITFELQHKSQGTRRSKAFFASSTASLRACCEAEHINQIGIN